MERVLEKRPDPLQFFLLGVSASLYLLLQESQLACSECSPPLVLCRDIGVPVPAPRIEKNNSSLFTSPWHFCFVCLCSYNRRRWTMPSSSGHVSLLNKGAFGWEFATFKLLCEIFSSVQSQIMDEYEDCSFGSECFGLLYSGLGFLLRGRRGSHGLTSETASAICIIILLF